MRTQLCGTLSECPSEGICEICGESPIEYMPDPVRGAQIIASIKLMNKLNKICCKRKEQDELVITS